jgi:hypothetical protein
VPRVEAGSQLARRALRVVNSTTQFVQVAANQPPFLLFLAKIVQSIVVIASRPNAPRVHSAMMRAVIVVVTTVAAAAGAVTVAMVVATAAIAAGSNVISKETHKSILYPYKGTGCLLFKAGTERNSYYICYTEAELLYILDMEVILL